LSTRSAPLHNELVDALRACLAGRRIAIHAMEGKLID
jgi:hypothetical protein